MDVTLEKSSVFDLPSQNRVGAIVHGGAADAQLWPGRGPDAALRGAFGDDLQSVLDAELKQLGVSALPVPQPMRVSRGRLHCDFLVWLAIRDPEPGTTQSQAPDEARLSLAIQNALEFVSERGVVRVAFDAVGAGANELPHVERLLVMAKAAQAFEDARRAAGRAAVIEEVILCEPDLKLFSLARSRLGSLARAVTPPTKAPEPTKREARKAEAAKAASKRGARKLAPEDIDRHRLSSAPYSMKGRYTVGEYMLHARFGVGRIEQVLPEGAVTVLFEDGETRKMVHGRS